MLCEIAAANKEQKTYFTDDTAQTSQLFAMASGNRTSIKAQQVAAADRKQFGGRRWRKLKGEGRVRFPNGEIRQAELHWYEAHGVGRRKMKVKQVLD